ncbi:Rrf2 family transcriptional regulator [bacterium]|nr:Rrf2 family transcriptional regulator [bacterium]
MLSQTVEYALRAVTFMATSPKAAHTVDRIAEATHVPVAYLAKVMQQLVKGRIVASRRGVGGGFMLAKQPDRLRILEVVQAVDPIQRIATCPLGIAAHGKKLCPLHRRLDADELKLDFDDSCGYLRSVLDALPDELRERFWNRMDAALGGTDASETFAHLSADDRDAIRGILAATKPGAPGHWKKP